MKRKNLPVFDNTLPKNLPLLFQSRAKICANIPSQSEKNSQGDFISYTYRQVYKSILELSVVLKETIGVVRGDKIALISDNRREWLITDMAVMSLGAADVPRGCDSTGKEIRFIISFAQCTGGFFENKKQLLKVLEVQEEVPSLRWAVLFDNPEDEFIAFVEEKGIKLFLFDRLLVQGKTKIEADPHLKAVIENEMQMTDGDEIATYIFTSGTTGVPKGVMLSHRNFITQLEVFHNLIPVEEGDVWLSVLPVWHSFERAVTYVIIALKSCIAYSKPVASVMLSDFGKVHPKWMCGVPRLWESLAVGINRSVKKKGALKYGVFRFFIDVGKKYSWAKDHVTGKVCRYSKADSFFYFLYGILPFIFLFPFSAIGERVVYRKIREKFGGSFQAVLSGGGSLQKETEYFFKAIRFTLLEGYGLTETAPILSMRSVWENRPGCVGKILPCVEVKVVKEKNGKIISKDPLPPGKRGMILARGDQVMRGYYNRPDLTREIIDDDGWINTGDLGILTYDNEIKITGRAKDTIVLLGGENVEPVLIEKTIKESSFVETAVVLGQDKKYLAALIVPYADAVENYARENGITIGDYDALLETPEIISLFREEIDSRINTAGGFRTCERIYKFLLLSRSFTIGEELSAKQELVRYKINQKYKKEIEGLFSEK